MKTVGHSEVYDGFATSLKITTTVCDEMIAFALSHMNYLLCEVIEVLILGLIVFVVEQRAQ